MEKKIWLSYDLSLNGDYEGLYRWLDKRRAEECGSGLAVFQFTFSSSDLTDSAEAQELLDSIKEYMHINEIRDRIYAVWGRNSRRIAGRFLVGNRKRAPWEGMAGLGTDVSDD